MPQQSDVYKTGSKPEGGRKHANPIRVLKPVVLGPMDRMFRFLVRFGIVLALTIGVLLLPTPAGLSAEGHRALAAFVFTASVLALEPVSLPIAALMVPAALVALGVATAPQVFETFSRPVVFLILASLFLAEALRKHGLTRRLALSTIVMSRGGVGALLFGLMSLSAFFYMWVGNTATAAMPIPVALTISRQVSEKDLLNNTTIAAVFVPVLITLCRAIPSLDPVQLVLPVTLATTLGYSLPSASGRMALISSTGIVSFGKNALRPDLDGNQLRGAGLDFLFDNRLQSYIKTFKLSNYFKKNPKIKIISADPREEIFAVGEGILASVDIEKMLTPLNLEHVLEEAKPAFPLFKRGIEGILKYH